MITPNRTYSEKEGPTVERIWLELPFSQNAAAKAVGARWDHQSRRWYAPEGTVGLDKWIPIPELLPGEDRTYGHGLFVDPIPESCWFTNVRSCVEPKDWDRLRRMIYRRAGNVCEACHSPADKPAGIWLEAHERWTYDETTLTQKLIRLICLCTRCHRATHYGYAQVTHTDAAAREQLATVNGWTPQQVRRHIDDAIDTWLIRNRSIWHLDLAILVGAGVRIAAPPASHDRPMAARTALDRARGPFTSM